MWNGNPAYWGYHAPLLFPIIGNVKNDTITVNGEKYTLLRHGFARTSTFTLSEQSNNKLTFTLTHSPDTLKLYPFQFTFHISYVIEGNSVKTICEVINTDAQSIYFQIGGHPTFLCPFNEKETFDNYYLEFEKEEEPVQLFLNKAGLFMREEKPYANKKIIPLSYRLFEKDAIVLKDLMSEYIMLKSKKSSNHIRFNMSQFPVLGIWTKPQAPFVCIEPWYGHADYVDFDGEFKDKPGIIPLEKSKTFTCEYSVQINDSL